MEGDLLRRRVPRFSFDAFFLRPLRDEASESESEDDDEYDLRDRPLLFLSPPRLLLLFFLRLSDEYELYDEEDVYDDEELDEKELLLELSKLLVSDELLEITDEASLSSIFC